MAVSALCIFSGIYKRASWIHYSTRFHNMLHDTCQEVSDDIQGVGVEMLDCIDNRLLPMVWRGIC